MLELFYQNREEEVLEDRALGGDSHVGNQNLSQQQPNEETKDVPGASSGIR